MTEKNQKQFESALEIAKKIYDRELSEEEIEAIKKQYDNPIAESIELRAGETDLTHLKQSKMNQLFIRNQADTLAYLKLLNATLNDLYYAFAYFLKKNGSEDVFKEIEEFSSEEFKKIKGE